MIKIITIPEELRNDIQRANLEKDSRKEILIYILQNNLDIPKERLDQYQKEYDEKYFLFESLKQKLENEYIKPLSLNQFKWSLNYSNCEVTIEYE